MNLLNVTDAWTDEHLAISHLYDFASMSFYSLATNVE